MANFINEFKRRKEIGMYVCSSTFISCLLKAIKYPCD